LPTLSQLPGELNVSVVVGDELNIPVSLYVDVRGFTWECFVYFIYDVTAGGGAVYQARYNVFSPTVGVVDAASGSLVIGLSEAQTSQLVPNYAYRWYLRWVATGQITRTIVSGTLTLSYP
jgi:hypothetical protein